jgi:hypothetical protein
MGLPQKFFAPLLQNDLEMRIFHERRSLGVHESPIQGGDSSLCLEART